MSYKIPSQIFCEGFFLEGAVAHAARGGDGRQKGKAMR